MGLNHDPGVTCPDDLSKRRREPQWAKQAGRELQDID